ncbi:MAG: DUF6310 domain-containing protein [Myxococcota bacterium]
MRVAVLLLALSACGGSGEAQVLAGQSADAARAAAEDRALDRIWASIASSSGSAGSAGDPARRTRLADALTAARSDLRALAAACRAQRDGRAVSCTDAPGSAVQTAGRELERSLDELSRQLAFGRRVIPEPPPPDDPDDPQRRRRRCVPTPVCPHRGGDTHHDACADREPPNAYPGCDVRLNGKLFDALGKTDGAMWEVKTDAWSSYSPFLQRLTLSAHLAAAPFEKKLALQCGYQFVFAVADERLFSILDERFQGVVTTRHVPHCAR